jgi:hypothetical protein
MYQCVLFSLHLAKIQTTGLFYKIIITKSMTARSLAVEMFVALSTKS